MWGWGQHVISREPGLIRQLTGPGSHDDESLHNFTPPPNQRRVACIAPSTVRSSIHGTICALLPQQNC